MFGMIWASINESKSQIGTCISARNTAQFNTHYFSFMIYYLSVWFKYYTTYIYDYGRHGMTRRFLSERTLSGWGRRIDPPTRC